MSAHIHTWLTCGPVTPSPARVSPASKQQWEADLFTPTRSPAPAPTPGKLASGKKKKEKRVENNGLNAGIEGVVWGTVQRETARDERRGLLIYMWIVQVKGGKGNAFYSMRSG